MKLQDNRETLFSDTIKQIQLGIKRTATYPTDHPMSNQIIDKSYRTLGNLLKKDNALTINILGDRLMVNDVPIESKNAFCRDFLSYCKNRDIDNINFYDGLSVKEFMIFLHAMIKSPNILKENGGVASILRKNEVSRIKLNRLKIRMVQKELKTIERKQMPNDLQSESNVFFNKELETRKEVKFHRDVYKQRERNISKNNINNLLSEGRVDDVQKLIKNLNNRFDDSSCKIRFKVAQHFREISSALDEFDKLKENFQEISEALIRRVKQETHANIYLAASENLHKICTSQNRIDSYFIEETIGHRLFKENKLSQDQLQKIMTVRNANGKSFQYNLAALNVVDEKVLIQFLAQQYKGCQTTILSNINHLPKHILKTIPLKFIEKYNILPLRSDFGYLHVATMNPKNLDVLNDIRFMSGYSIVPYLAAEYYLINCIEKFYHLNNKISKKMRAMNEMKKGDNLEFIEEEKGERIEIDELTDTDAPVVNLVNLILKEALAKNSSDIHIEPFENEMRVRFRTDGTLTTSLTPSIKYARVIASRIKIMAGLDISERRLPQDGRFKVKMNGNYIDFRVSTFPGIYGEKVVLRLLDKSNVLLDLKSMGFSSKALDSVLTAMYKSKGMILVTGPTGSGKTTTLYSMLHVLNDGAMNISTAEDPIEYHFSGINQFQMNSKIGLGFARALRTLLRQDPDIIMVGEIRDLETAETAVRAALTGHIVLSTLHTNNAPETVTRLIDMGIEPYLITSSMNLVIAQRLMRKICDKCKVEVSPSDLQMKILKNHGLEINNHKVFIGDGCDECNNTGYKGRFAIHEVMPLWDEMQGFILERKSSFEIRKKARELGLVTLQEQGFAKVLEGKTSLDEWMRVVA